MDILRLGIMSGSPEAFAFASGDTAAPRPRPDEQTRRHAGLAARERIGRRDLGRWDEASRNQDPVASLQAQNAIRRPELLPLRFGRMVESSWNFYRGAAAVAAADLASRPDTGLLVQLCGDAHILNFGLWRTPERTLAFDLRDFDETLPGPFEWDVCRLVASIAVLARHTGVKSSVADEAVATCVGAYRSKMADYTSAHQMDIWYDLFTVDNFLDVFSGSDRRLGSAHIKKKARERTSSGAAKKLTEKVDGRLRITQDPPLRQRFSDGVATDVYASYRLSLPEDRRHLLDQFTVVDAVRQVVGVGSVGMRVFLVLLVGRNQADPLFLQVKQAGPSVYERFCGPSEHANHGQRVVVGKRLIQSATDIFVGWTTQDGIDYYVRQFRDSKVIPDTEMVAPRLVAFAEACGKVLARSHARTGDPVAIDAYLGTNDHFTEAMGDFAEKYALQTELDHSRLRSAAAAGQIQTT